MTTHRRAIKTHAPADAIPLYEECRYIAVFRDARDAFTSWINHRRGMRAEIVQLCNDVTAADGVQPWDPVWDGDVDALVDEWLDYTSPGEQLASWWPLRRRANVLLVHYRDLLDDLDGEMRRIADFLAIDVPTQQWPEVVARCRFDAMKSAHRASTRLAIGFDRAAERFFHEGGNGRWRQELTPAQADAVVTAVERRLSRRAADWLACGSLAVGWRP